MFRTRVPDDNDPSNLRHDHGHYTCPDYARSVQSETSDLDALGRRLFDWWESHGRFQVRRLDVAQHFGWNCRFAGDVLFHLRDPRGLVESTGRGGRWYRTFDVRAPAPAPQVGPPVCPTCYTQLPRTGRCDTCS